MPTNFPGGLDALPSPGIATEEDDVGFEHDLVHTDANDAIEALQAKVGVDGSAVVASLDYLIKSTTGGHDHDGVGSRQVDHSSLTGITANQHHAQAHTHPAQGAVVVTHASTTGQTANDHHAQSHTDADHSDGPNSKPGHTHSHDTDLTGVSADDHHAQLHAAQHATAGGDPVSPADIGAASSVHTHTHASTTGQTANDHHAQSHGHTGADGSGTVSHTDLTSVSADQHHAQSHSHASHTGIGANDHHAQVHTNADHTGGIVATDPIFDAKGDLAVGTGADAASRLAVGADKTMLMALASEGTGLKYEKPSRVVASTEATNTIVNNNTEQNLFSLTLPGGLVAAGDYLIIEAGGTLLNNTAGNVTYTWRFKIGTTTVLATAAGTETASANRRHWLCRIVVAFGTTAAERVTGAIFTGAATTDTWQTPSRSDRGYGTAAENTATDKALALTIQMGTMSVNADAVLEFASLIHVRKP